MSYKSAPRGSYQVALALRLSLTRLARPPARDASHSIEAPRSTGHSGRGASAELTRSPQVKLRLTRANTVISPRVNRLREQPDATAGSGQRNGRNATQG